MGVTVYSLSLYQLGHYSFENLLRILKYIIIPESQHRKPFAFQPSVSLFVVFFLFQMLTAVNLNYKISLKTYKIHYVIPEGFLPSKFCIL